MEHHVGVIPVEETVLAWDLLHRPTPTGEKLFETFIQCCLVVARQHVFQPRGLRLHRVPSAKPFRLRSLPALLILLGDSQTVTVEGHPLRLRDGDLLTVTSPRVSLEFPEGSSLVVEVPLWV